MQLEGARLGLGGLDPDEPPRQRWRPRSEIGDEPSAGGVRRRVDQPFLVWVRVENRRDLGEERRLEPGEARLRERADGTVVDPPLGERKRRIARQRADRGLLEAETLGERAPVAEVRRGEHDEVRGFAQELTRRRRHRERDQLERGAGLGRIAHDPLPVLRVDEEADAGERGFQTFALHHQLLLRSGGRDAQKGLGRDTGGSHDLECTRERLELAIEPLEMLAHEGSVRLRRVEARQRPAEPRLGQLGREGDGEDADKLGFEVVRLVDDQEAPLAQLVGAPVAERGEIRGVGAEDRAGEGGRLRPRVRALAQRAARSAAHAPRSGNACLRVSLAEVVVAPFDELEVGAELALVLVLQKLLGRQEICVAAPAGERHGDVALADSRRCLDDEDAWRGGVVEGFGNGVGQRCQEARLLRPRGEARGKVREQVDAIHHACVAPRRG